MTAKKRSKSAKSLMHTDIKDLEIGRKLRELGEIRVTEWELGAVFPAVKELANKEVDVAGFFRRTANYKVFEWDFRKALRNAESEPDRKASSGDVRACLENLTRFLGYVCEGLLVEPAGRRIDVVQRADFDFQIRMVLPRQGLAVLVGHGGHTAAALRNLVEDSGRRIGLTVDLKIMSEEDSAPSASLSFPPAKHSVANLPTRSKSGLARPCRQDSAKSDRKSAGKPRKHPHSRMGDE